MSQGQDKPKTRALAWPGAVRAPPRLRLDDWLALAGAWFGRQLAIEIDNRTPFLWLPAAFGTGICLYFAADGEPSLLYAGVLAVLAAGLALATRTGFKRRVLFLGVAMVLLGIVAAGHRTQQIAAPVLARLTIAPVTGFVETIERRGQGSRLVIAVDSIGNLDAETRPKRVRVTTRAPVDIRPGDYISGTMRLLPPPEPARPGGYDFARDAFFKQIGAVGSVTGRLATVPPPRPPGWRMRVDVTIDQARNVLTERIAQSFGGQAGAVAAALVTGKRGLIDEETNEALRAAGIYHVVSISGLHMVLVAGAVFWTLRALLALSTTLALTWPIKKIAALGAMLGSTAYCIFSGGEVATERALVMTLTMMGAILFDRPALSLRNLAIAALIVLAMEPETLLGPSFQMSFAAVAGLVAFAGIFFGARDGGRTPPDRVSRLLRSWRNAALALIATTFIATVATAPFGIFHFQAVNPFGLLGNALALPFVSLVVMPSAVAGAFLAPLGLDGPVWWLMGQGVEIVLSIARHLEAFEGSRSLVPAFGTPALVSLAIALLMATLLASGLRWLALAPLVVGLAGAATPQRPDILVDRAAGGAAIRGAEGRLVVVGRPSEFVVAQWLAADGDERRPDETGLRAGAACDPAGCVVTLPDGRHVSFLLDASAFAEDCDRAAIVILRGKAPKPCLKALVIDRATLDERGAVAIFAGPAPARLAPAKSEAGSAAREQGFVIQGARDGTASRLWARQAAIRPASPTPANVDSTAGPDADGEDDGDE